MMEIVYGPAIAACALQSLLFGLVFALSLPHLEVRCTGILRGGALRRTGLGLVGGGLYGLAHLTLVCANDGFPPRIIQSTGVALILVGIVIAVS